MSDFFKTTDLSYNELLAIYERISKDYQKETQENAELKKSLSHFRFENERLERRVNELKKQLSHEKNPTIP